MFRFFKAKPKPLAPVRPEIDLKRFSCAGIELGAEVPDDAFFIHDVGPEGTYANAGSGIELGVVDGMLDSIFITLASFDGHLLVGENELGFGRNVTEAQVEKLFGEPFHRSVDEEGEVIRFYEYRSGGIELQFEFPPNCGLEFISICRDGVLSCEEQRRSYGVTRAWPPTDH